MSNRHKKLYLKGLVAESAPVDNKVSVSEGLIDFSVDQLLYFTPKSKVLEEVLKENKPVRKLRK